MTIRRDRVRADRRANMMEFRVDGTVAETELKLRLFSYVAYIRSEKRISEPRGQPLNAGYP